jgi:hypothetical protein
MFYFLHHMHEQNSVDKKLVHFELLRESKRTSRNLVTKTAKTPSFILTSTKIINKYQGHNVH